MCCTGFADWEARAMNTPLLPPAAATVNSTSGRSISLMLVDDERFYRSAMSRVLGQEPDMAVVAEASSFAEAHEFLCNYCGTVDVALLDLHLPDGSGIDLIYRLKDCCPHARAVVMAGKMDPREKAQVVEAGGFGYLDKSAALDDVTTAIRKAAAGKPILSPEETIALLRAIGIDRLRERPGPERVEHLTDREQEILAALAEGLTDKEMAGRLQISVATVHTHVTNILSKMDVHSRAQAIIAAVRAGLVELG